MRAEAQGKVIEEDRDPTVHYTEHDFPTATILVDGQGKVILSDKSIDEIVNRVLKVVMPYLDGDEIYLSAAEKRAASNH